MKNKILTLIIGAVSFMGFAQTQISLETAYDKAVQNNLDIKTGQLKAEYQNRLINSYRTIDPVNISAEFGQINSAYFDNKISASQTIRLPKYYKAQKAIFEEEWKNANLSLDMQKWQIKRELALIYNNLNYLDEKEKLIRKTESIYSNYYKRAELRLKAGESNILEKTTAESYRSQAEIQLKNIQKDREVALMQFNYLINGSEQFQNERGNFFNMNFDGNLQTPGSWLMKQAEQQRNIETARLESEKVKLLPSFNVGINSTTMKGVNANDKYYDGIHRFQSGVVGVALPVFNTSQKAVIEAQKLNLQIAESHFELAKKQLQSQLAQNIGEYEKLKSETDYYKKTGLKNAEKIMFTAELLLKEGEMNYMEYSLLINQSLEIQNKYLDAVKQLNDRIIELNYLKSQD